MKRLVFMVLGIALAIPAFSQSGISNDILNNQYHLESIRFRNLAQEAFDDDDYDQSVEYAAEAIRQVQLSDEYITLHLKIGQANNAMASARDRLDWATDTGIGVRFPSQYGLALSFWGDAVRDKEKENWDGVINDSKEVIAALFGLGGEPLVLPGEYTVQSWILAEDCLWNIAGKSWVYNDPRKWRILYEANKSKLSKPNNPDHLSPGTVLTIPSLHGETRQGAWEEGAEYPAFE